MGKGRKEALDRGPFVYDTQGDKKEGRKIEIAQAKKDQDHLQAKCPIRIVAVGEQRQLLDEGGEFGGRKRLHRSDLKETEEPSDQSEMAKQEEANARKQGRISAAHDP